MALHFALLITIHRWYLRAARGEGRIIIIKSMEDPRIELLQNIDHSKTRVEFSDSPIVLLCGGSVKQKERPDDPTPPVQSFRHALTEKNTRYEIFRPEEITTWQTDSVYKNLVDFEKDLAGICSLVVIILESPGAIAELAAFSQLKELSNKIIVLKSLDFKNAISFINLGILRYIEESHKSSVKMYPWTVTAPPELPNISEEVIDDAIEDIQNELNDLPRSQKIRFQNTSHAITLICELCRIFVALKEGEILKYLGEFGITLHKDELKSKLFLLQEFKLIEKIEYSDSKFYIRTNELYNKIRISGKDGKYIDTLRIGVECSEFYKTSEKDKHRSRALKQIPNRAEQ